MIGRAGHDTVHDRFCIQLMVNAVQELYDRGARRSARARSRPPPADRPPPRSEERARTFG